MKHWYLVQVHDFQGFVTKNEFSHMFITSLGDISVKSADFSVFAWWDPSLRLCCVPVMKSLRQMISCSFRSWKHVKNVWAWHPRLDQDSIHFRVSLSGLRYFKCFRVLQVMVSEASSHVFCPLGEKLSFYHPGHAECCCSVGNQDSLARTDKCCLCISKCGVLTQRRSYDFIAKLEVPPTSLSTYDANIFRY